MTKIVLGKVGITNEGKWNEKKPYPVLGLVTHEGQGYISFRKNIGVTPGTDETTWMLIVERGESLYQMMVRKGLFVGSEDDFLAEYQNVLAAARQATEDSKAQMQTVSTTMQQYAIAEETREGNEAQRNAKMDEYATTMQQYEAEENTRKSNEENRNNQMKVYDSTMEGYALKEETREANETNRKSAETLRAEAETQRGTNFDTLSQQMNDKMAESDRTTATANAAAQKATEAATTIDAKINPVVESDKAQNDKIAALEKSVSDLQQYHGDDYCVASYDKAQLAPEALEVKGSKAFALAWYPWLVDMTDNAGEAVTKAYTLKRNNWFRRASSGVFAPAVCVTAEDYALCDAELYLDAAHTQKYCDAGAFDAVAFYNEHGVTQKLYNVDGSEVKHIRRPWETTNKDLGQYVGRKDTIRLCDNLIGRSGKVLKGIFGSQTNFDGAQFGQFELKPTGLAPTPVCTVGNKSRSFFYLMEGETNCKSASGLGGCTDMLAPKNRTFPRCSDMHQMTTMQRARANNADPASPVPFAEGGFMALNAFLTCMEVGYGTKALHDPDMFSSGVSSNDTCNNEETWRHYGGVRLRKQGEVDYKYHTWGSSSEMCYDAQGHSQNLSYQLNQYTPKVGVNEMQIAASYAVELGIPEGQEYEMYGATYYWESVPGAKSLTEGEMNCRMYKVVKGLFNGFLKDGTPQVWEVECCLRVGLLQGMDVSGDVFCYWGGGYEQIGHTTKAGNGTGFPVEFYLQPDQKRWKNITGVTIDDTEQFGVEDSYIHVGGTIIKGDGYTLTRNAYSAYPEEKGGGIRTGECFYGWVNNYWCSTIHKFCRVAARFRGSANFGFCAPRFLTAYNAVSNADADYAGSAQVMLGAAECNALQAQPQTQSEPTA